MAEKPSILKRKTTYPTILFGVLSLHALVLIAFKGIPKPDLSMFDGQQNDEPFLIKIRPVKTPRIGKSLTNVNIPIDSIGGLTPPKKNKKVDLKDLAIQRPQEQLNQRPGSRPEAGPKRPTAINAVRQLSMKDQDFKDYTKSSTSGVADLSSLDTRAFKVSDATIGIENPEGVEPDELNENELVYYSFQKRMLVGYINTIVKEIEKFQKKHRNFQLDPNSKILMTARLTYDSEGNVKQIKMVRWSNLDPLQGVFEESMKNLNQLNNPPKDLWSKSGEFNVFYSWIISNG